MLADRLQVAYSRKVSQQVADGKFETISLGGSIEFDVTEGEQWQEAYEGAYVAYKLIVDQLVDEALPKAQVASTVVNNQATLPGEKIAPRPAPASNGITAYEPREFTGCTVERVEVSFTKNGKEWAKARIRNDNQIPNRFTDAKSFEPPIVARLKALNAGDTINIKGHFEPWKVNPDRFDLVVESVDKVAA